MKKIFTADQFETSGSFSAEGQVEAVNSLALFIQKGCPRSLFTRQICVCASGMFENFFLFDRNQWWDAYLSTPEKRELFVRTMRREGIARPPWVDVAVRLGDWLDSRPFLLAAYKAAAEEERAT